MENIKYLTETVTKHKIYSIRGEENIICKIGRQMSESDNKFWDVQDEEYGTFKVQVEENEKSCKILFNNRTIIQGLLFIMEHKEWKNKKHLK